MPTALRIGTRGSQLALWQARTVAAALEGRGATVELVTIKTSGDRLQDAPMSEVGGKRLFVKEIEDALLAGTVDIAVHSAKDMPALLPDGLAIAATLPREDPRDAFVLGREFRGTAKAALSEISRANIGTSSVRRIAQLQRLLPRATFSAIRGNVDTRLRKLDAGEYDALVLAAAGLRRLGFSARITETIDPDDCLPAPGQGIIAVEIRAGDDTTGAAVRALHDHEAGVTLAAERAVVDALGGGCQLPLGAFATISGNMLHLRALVCAPDGSRLVRASGTGTTDTAESVGRQVAQSLVSEGAISILDQVRASQTAD